MITLSNSCVKKLKEVCSSTGTEPVLRAGVKGGGCAGYSYFFEFIERSEAKETDELCEQDGISIYIDMLSHQYLDGMSIDYIEDGLVNTGFKFNNPNSKSSCGCGSSFSV